MPLPNNLCRVDFVYEEGPGTPPFATHLDFTTTEPLVPPTINQLATDLAEIWRTNISAINISSEFTAGTCYVRTEAGGIVLEAQQDMVNPGGTSSPRLPGASFRVIKQAERPVGKRTSSMYIPGAVAGAYDDKGVIFALASIREDVEKFYEDFLEVDKVDKIVQLRGTTSGGTWTPDDWSLVTGFAVAPTISYLNRRYR